MTLRDRARPAGVMSSSAPPLLLLLVAACGADAYTGDADTGQNGPPFDDSGLDDDSADTGADVRAAWFAPAGELTVTDGLPAPAPAALRISVRGDDADDELCVVPLDVSGLVAGASPDPAVPHWWELDLVATDPCAPLPDHLGLGVGAITPDVVARLGAVGLEEAADSLYGAYVRVDDGEVQVYGWAGTDADQTGGTPAASPPPDGTYTLGPLYVLPLAGG